MSDLAIADSPQTKPEANNSRPGRSALTTFDYFLFFVTVLAWSGSWYALKLQVGLVPVQVSLFWRYVLAALIMMAWVVITRAPMRFSLVDHTKFLLMGALMFCINFALFYNASIYLASGLLSVVFSLASIFNIIIAVLFLGLKPGVNVIVGALLGFIGIGMMFWPVVASQSFDVAAFFGLGLCIAGTLCFCTGNLISATLQNSKVPVVSASAWGMTYGAGLSALIAFAQGHEFMIDWSPSYIGSLIFLAIVSSVIAFAAYLTLLGRIGADRAGYATVLFPVIALLISTIMEDYRMTLLAVAGLAMVLLGNVFVLGKKRKH